MITEPSILALLVFVGFILAALVLANLTFVTIRSLRGIKEGGQQVEIETNGVKHGLTVVEAAVLMELPLGEIMRLILFGVAQKRAAQIISLAPLKLRVFDSVLATLGSYEISFLKSFETKDIETRQLLLSGMVTSLVDIVAEKMKGSNRQATRDYYSSIVKQALLEVASSAFKNVTFDDEIGFETLSDLYHHRLRSLFEEIDLLAPISAVAEALSAEIVDNNNNFNEHASKDLRPND